MLRIEGSFWVGGMVVSWDHRRHHAGRPVCLTPSTDPAQIAPAAAPARPQTACCLAAAPRVNVRTTQPLHARQRGQNGSEANLYLRAPRPRTGCGVPAAVVGVAGFSPPRPSCWNNSGPECLLSVSRWLGGSRRASWVSSFLGWGKPWSRPRGADRSRRSSSRRGDRLPLRPSSVRRQGIIEPSGMVRSCAHGTTRARARHAARSWSPRVTVPGGRLAAACPPVYGSDPSG